MSFITSYPDERILFSMEDASAGILLTSRRLKEQRPALSGSGFEVLTMEDIFDAQTDDTYPSPDGIRSEDLAYCIYTSGSTGRPKGVMIEQGTLLNPE
ncbi:AMP-binding protein [Butyrivibrio sp. JL13D10]|uniref:AMP-binding protein n=1 Tax=Butyrivibrio sp. JL13D10 TaxID=3236815 RepID=UPI0038B6068C